VQGFDEPAESWFWSPRKPQEADDKVEEDEPENQKTVNEDRVQNNDQDEENVSEAEEIEFEVLFGHFNVCCHEFLL
jgi:hypothetical protein